eukprot:TRINITY_DN7606_c0_g1_i2.p1 TRINITY_DN7606_c0_g1~~TRINITY_DN7606_c0_g1_i2.p1  ORF type:complete len:234 (-),score=52.24 TRINITY_DN7606_c0_g1_i2:164-865(-)
MSKTPIACFAEKASKIRKMKALLIVIALVVTIACFECELDFDQDGIENFCRNPDTSGPTRQRTEGVPSNILEGNAVQLQIGVNEEGWCTAFRVSEFTFLSSGDCFGDETGIRQEDDDDVSISIFTRPHRGVTLSISEREYLSRIDFAGINGNHVDAALIRDLQNSPSIARLNEPYSLLVDSQNVLLGKKDVPCFVSGFAGFVDRDYYEDNNMVHNEHVTYDAYIELMIPVYMG